MPHAIFWLWVIVATIATVAMGALINRLVIRSCSRSESQTKKNSHNRCC